MYYYFFDLAIDIIIFSNTHIVTTLLHTNRTEIFPTATIAMGTSTKLATTV